VNLVGWADGAWADGSWVEASWGEGAEEPHGVESQLSAGIVTPDSTTALTGVEMLSGIGTLVASEGDAPVVVETEIVTGRSGRRRYRIIADPDILEEQLAVEEKKVEKDKKKLKILIKRVDSPNVEGILYQQIQEKVEKLEAKIDDRMEKIAQLMLAIQVGLDEQDDDEEEVLLMS
jgi:hypothetical protein